MAKINFPSSPSLNDSYTFNAITWQWDGEKWKKSSSTETGNAEGNTGEVAYYSGKGSDIAGATAFFYDGDKVGIGTSGPAETLDVRGGITASGVLYAAGGATFGGHVNVKGNVYIPDDGYIGIAGDTERISFNGSGVGSSSIDIQGSIIDFGNGNGCELRSHGDQDVSLKFVDNKHGAFKDGLELKHSGKVMIDVTPTQVNVAGATFGGAGGATFGGQVNITSKGDANLHLIADTDDSGETDIPLILLSSDGGNHQANVGLVGSAGSYFTGSISNAMFFEGLGGKDIQFANNNLVRQTIHQATGLTEFHYGVSGDAGATFGGPVQVYGGITASGKLYAGEGITSGGDIKVGGDILLLNGDIHLGQKSIMDGSGNPVFKVNGDRFVYFGDADSSANDTKIMIRDTHSTIVMDADNSIDLNTPTVSVKDDIEHSGDSNTKINFTTDRIDFIVGGATAARISHVGGTRNPPAMLEAPFGITCGIAGVDTGSIYTPHGVTCGSLEVGGYWAGQHEEIIGISVSNGSQVLTTGKKGHREIPYDCEVTQWTVTSTDSGSIQWDINWCTYANWATTASVAGSNLPSISSAYKNQDKTVNWTKTSFAAGDIIEFEIDTVSILTNCTLSLKIRRIG